MARTVFVSRAGSDRDAAIAIAQVLRAAGDDVVLQDETFGHTSFLEQMDRGLADADCFVLLLSQAYLDSDYCRLEYQAAVHGDPLNRRGRVVVLRLEDTPPPATLKLIPYYDLFALPGEVARLVRVALGHERAPAEVDWARRYLRRTDRVRANEFRERPDFTGRQAELAAIESALAHRPVVVLHGLPGAGKSQLAREFGWAHRERFGGMWWARASTESLLIGDLATLAARIVPDAGEMKAEEAARLALAHVTRATEPWLLVYDNVPDASWVRGWLPAEGAQVVITTRDTRWDEVAAAVPVGAFDEATAVAYLLGDEGGDREGAARLAAALQGLPLALSHARAVCRSRRMSFGAYLERLPEWIGRAPQKVEYRDTVAATFTAALERAIEEDPGAEVLIEVLACLAPERAPLWLVPPELLSEDAARDAAAALAGLSLVAWDAGEAGSDALTTHRVVQAVARARAGERIGAVAGQVAERVYATFDRSETVEGHQRNGEWLPHAEAVVGHAPDSREVTWIWLLVGDVRVQRGETDRADGAYRCGLGVAERRAESHDVSASHDRLGEVQRAQGQLDAARRSYEASLVLRKRLASSAPWDTALQRDLSVALEKVGDVRVAGGDLHAARQNYAASLAISERLAGSDPRNEGWQRDLSVSHRKVGAVQESLGNLDAARQSYEASQAIAERLAASDPQNLDWQRDLSASHAKVGDVRVAQGDLDAARQSYEASRAICERVAASDPRNAQWQRDLSVSHRRVGDVQVAQGDPDAARQSYETYRAIAERLALSDPRNAGWQRTLSLSHLAFGDVYVVQGDLDGARQSYEASRTIAERLAASDPRNAEWQRDLSVSHSRVGDVQVAQGDLDGARQSYEASRALAERLAVADPRNAGWQRDLSVSHKRVGDVQVAEGDLHAALQSYEAAMAIAERLAATNPRNAVWQRNLSISQNKVGDVQLAQGDLDAACQSYEASRAIAERLAASDPRSAEWQRDLSVSHEKVGNVQRAQGDLDAARQSYEASRSIREHLAASDPRNAGWQRDLSVAHNKVGDVQRAQGDLDAARQSYEVARALAERLAAADPRNAGLQHDLSISHDRVGDVQLAQGNLDAARQSYEASRAIAERLAASDPRNAEWQRGLSLSAEKVGDVRVAQGNLGAARQSYEASRAIRERLATLNPGNAGLRRDLSVSHIKVGDVQRASGDLDAARLSYEASRAIAERLAASDPRNTGWLRDLSVSHNRVGDVQLAQADLDAARQSYEASRAIAVRLTGSDPGNVGSQHDVALSLLRVGEIAARTGHPDEARAHFRRGLEIMTRLTALAPTHAGFARDHRWFADRLAALEGAPDPSVPVVTDKPRPAPVVADTQPPRPPSLSVFAPRRARAGHPFLVQAAVHLPEHSDLASRLAAENAPDGERRGVKALAAAVPVGTEITLELESADLACPEPRQSLVWTGDPALVEFLVRAPARICPFTAHLTVRVSLGPAPIGRLTCTIEVARRAPADPPSEARPGWQPYRYAFLSYASEDRPTVEAVSAALTEAGVPHFFDIQSLRAGDAWESALKDHVRRADLFLLYWSEASARSRWVAQEAAWAREIRDAAPDHRPDIRPYLLGVEPPPPPAHLSALHFERLREPPPPTEPRPRSGPTA